MAPTRRPPPSFGFLAVLLGAAVSPTLVHAACGPAAGGADDASAVAVRDSAGVRIVESSAPAWGAAEDWRVPAEPTLRIGAVDGPPERQLFQVRGALRLRDGRVVVANGRPPELRWYAADGGHLFTAEGEGDGPGEFRWIGRMWRTAGDTLLVWDPRARRLSAFDPAGRFQGSSRLAELGEPAVAEPLGSFADGSLLSSGRRLSGPEDLRLGLSRDSVDWLRHPDPETPADTLLRTPGTETFVQSFEGGFNMYLPPCGRRTLYALRGDRLFLGDTDRYQILVLRPDSGVVRSFRRLGAARPVRAEDVDRAREAWLARARDEDHRRRLRRDFDALPVHATMPAFSALLVDEADRLWVRVFAPPDDPANRWDVFDPDGRWLGTLRLPEGFHPMEIGEGRVLGVRRDALEVEYVERFRIETPLREG